jgi:diguanylate cyclase (GGDEF)-like protein
MVQEQIELLRQEATEELIKAASTDPLTGLFNRRKFFELAECEYKKSMRANRELAMLMIDVDNFKNINDLAGHNVGDSVLISISDAISDSVRETDVVCRFGGEEFAVLLFDTSEEGIERVCEKILKTVKKIKVEGWNELNGKITVSIGSSLLSKKSDLDSAIRAADKAMYESKRSGKNQATYLH